MPEKMIEGNLKQKALNNAFYASIIWPVFSIVIFWLLHNSFRFNFLYLAEIILFPVLGYFTKRASKIAAIGLLGLFIFDRVMYLINWLGYLTQLEPSNYIITIAQFLIISFVLWRTFYEAFLCLRKDKITLRGYFTLKKVGIILLVYLIAGNSPAVMIIMAIILWLDYREYRKIPKLYTENANQEQKK